MTPTDDPARPVTRCVCFDVSFATMLSFAREHRCGLDELRERFGCGRGCALCVPYIRLMLQTGDTAFPVIIDEPTV